ncbi:hypothetical protein QFC19_002761 [Naganishia cerealis]|uniref:Uncharacterized protein n=1 Tax=Naganishia cerealis TaxID=610337 RepID=A0ACC2W956_9TREE|nr:hypothetical protein QFC19_002761 [Naganishia cerealis]
MDDADWDTSPADAATATDTYARHAHTQWERLTTTYADAGYREGITPGKLTTLQRGFDEAYAASVVPSRRLGQLRGRVAALVAFLQSRQQQGDTTNGAGDADALLLQRAKEAKRLLARVRPETVLPVDEEALAHAAAEHPADGVVVDKDEWRGEEGVRERREMADVVQKLEDLGGQEKTTNEEREQQLLDSWERTVSLLEREAGL